MLNKRAEFRLIDVQALNEPSLMKEAHSLSVTKDSNPIELDYKASYESTLKSITASKHAEHNIDGDNTEFDLEAEIKSHPDSLYVKCFAIKADEMNDNGDFFSYDELKKATSSFVGVPVFTNHENTDINKAKGKVVHSWWNDDRNGIDIIARVDADAYPQLARGIKEEYVVGTSMGCQVQYSLCSICHNKAETPDQYCEHVRERKTRQVTSKKQKCAYHEHGDLDKCPECGSTKDNIKTFDVDKKAFEYNYGIKFIENSFVVNPACPDCGVTEIIDPQAFLAKVADIQARLPGMLKAAANANIICDDKQCIKFSGQQEINNMNQALDLLTSVSQSMLQQKDQIDLEFLSDLIQVLADLQTVTDELTEQGYGRLQSPDGDSSQPNVQQSVDPNGQQQQQPAATGGASKIHSGPAGGAGTVTSPMANTKRIYLDKVASNLLTNLKKINISPEIKKRGIKIDFKI